MGNIHKEHLNTMSFIADTIFIRTLGADGTYDIKGLTTLAVVILVILLLVLAPTILKALGYVNDQQKFIAYNFDPSAQRMKQTGSSFATLNGRVGENTADAQGFLGVPESPNFSGSAPNDALLDPNAVSKDSTGLGPLGEIAKADALAAKANPQKFHGKQGYADGKLVALSGMWNSKI